MIQVSRHSIAATTSLGAQSCCRPLLCAVLLGLFALFPRPGWAEAAPPSPATPPAASLPPAMPAAPPALHTTPAAPTQPPFDDAGWDTGWENILAGGRPAKVAVGKSGAPSTAAATPNATGLHERPLLARPAPADLGPLPSTPLPADSLRGPRTHDGFYLRASYGVAWLSTTFVPHEADSFFLSGVTYPLEFRVGTTGLRGLAAGFAFLTGSGDPPKKESADGVELPSPKSFGLSRLGGFLDYYPWLGRGAHVEASLGYYTLSVDGGSGRAGGWGYHVGVGYELWVAMQWSAGIVLGLHNGTLTNSRLAGPNNEKVSDEHSFVASSLAANLTYQ